MKFAVRREILIQIKRIATCSFVWIFLMEQNILLLSADNSKNLSFNGSIPREARIKGRFTKDRPTQAPALMGNHQEKQLRAY